MPWQCHIPSRTFRSQCKDDIFSILPKSPTFVKCLVVFSCIQNGDFFKTMTCQIKDLYNTQFSVKTLFPVAGWNCSSKANTCVVSLGRKTEKLLKI